MIPLNNLHALENSKLHAVLQNIIEKMMNIRNDTHCSIQLTWDGKRKAHLIGSFGMRIGAFSDRRKNKITIEKVSKEINFSGQENKYK